MLRFVLFFVLFVFYCPAVFAQGDVVVQQQGVEDDVVRVQLKPVEEARINSPMTGLVEKVSYKDGESVEKGDVLVTFVCDEQKARLAQAKARVGRQSKLLESARTLFKLGSASVTEIDVLKSELAEARAAVDLALAEVGDCKIVAPFSGVVSALLVKDHYSLREGDPVVEVVGGGAMEVEMIVPSLWLRWLKPGYGFRIKVDETGGVYKSRVVRLGGRVDPVTQSVKVYAVLDEDAPDLLPGMSGSAIFEEMEGKKEEKKEEGKAGYAGS